MLTRYKIGTISLGCDKNRVDTEIILGGLQDSYEITNDPKEADIIIVNTCGFIESSKQESIDTILEMAKYKNDFNCKLLIATGCLTQRYGKELLELMPEIDLLLGVNDYGKLQKAIENFMSTKKKEALLSREDNNVLSGKRVITTGRNTAYLKIGEGCSNFCTYCIIPKIRGNYRSRTIEDILSEAKELASSGVKEIILIAQDTTRYGIDLYGKKMLPELIEKISEIESIKWIRILYCYAEEITDELIQVIKNNDKVCKYLDMPIQHISNRILKLMNRRGTKEKITETIQKLRREVKDIVLRTTLIVGFPGETEQDFCELLEFVKETKFDKLGVFRYSPEEDTPASLMKDQISDEIKYEREKRVMTLQQNISKEINENKVGKVYDFLIENSNEQYYIGRIKEMSPEIDGYVYINKRTDLALNIGDIIKVRILEALEYDLIGDVYYESC